MNTLIENKRITAKSLSIDLFDDIDSDIVVSCARFIQRHISPVDYGYITFDGKKTRTSNYEIDRHFNREKYISPISQKDIVHHFSGQSTLYYTTRNKTQYFLCCFDIDWKDKHKAEYGDSNDSLSCAKYIQVELDLDDNHVYIEPSTSGEGVHMYALIFTGDLSAQKVQTISRQLSVSLSSKIKEEGFRCSLDGLFGTPSSFETRGQLAKIPRLSSYNNFITFRNLKVVSLKHLQSTLSLSSPVTDCGTPESTQQENLQEITPLSVPPTSLSSPVTDCGTPVPDILANGTNIERMNWTCRTLSNRLNRLPTVIELVQEYERLNLNTGEDKNNRRLKRAKDSIEYTSQTFNQLKVGPEINKRKIESYIKSLNLKEEELIFAQKKTLSIDTLVKWVCYFSSVLDIKHTNKDLDGTVSKNQAIKKLGINPEQYYLCKRLAEKYDMIVTQSNSYIVGKKCKKYQVGKSLKEHNNGN